MNGARCCRMLARGNANWIACDGFPQVSWSSGRRAGIRSKRRVRAWAGRRGRWVSRSLSRGRRSARCQKSAYRKKSTIANKILSKSWSERASWRAPGLLDGVLGCARKGQAGRKDSIWTEASVSGRFRGVRPLVETKASGKVSPIVPRGLTPPAGTSQVASCRAPGSPTADGSIIAWNARSFQISFLAGRSSLR